MSSEKALRGKMLKLWGSEGIVTVSESPIAPLLPSQISNFVSDVGIPKAVPAYDFNLLDPKSWKIVTLGGANREAGLKDVWPISQHESADVATGVDLATGQVFDLDLRGEQPPAFVNSSLPCFVEFVTLVEERRLAVEPDEIGLTDVDQRLREELEALDPKAFADEGTVWSMYFEEIEYGL